MPAKGRGQEGGGGTSSSPPVLPVKPLIVTRTTPDVSLTSARFSPHDPGLMLCGSSNGTIFIYKIEATSMLQGAREDTGEEASVSLMPIRRFVDGREPSRTASSMVAAAEWHPCHAGMFLVAG